MDWPKATEVTYFGSRIGTYVSCFQALVIIIFFNFIFFNYSCHTVLVSGVEYSDQTCLSYEAITKSPCFFPLDWLRRQESSGACVFSPLPSCGGRCSGGRERGALSTFCMLCSSALWGSSYHDPGSSFPFGRWENQGTEKLCNLPRATELASGEASVWARDVWCQIPCVKPLSLEMPAVWPCACADFTRSPAVYLLR